jgi:hypothetical protein
VSKRIRPQITTLLSVLAGIRHEANPGTVENNDENPADG